MKRLLSVAIAAMAASLSAGTYTWTGAAGDGSVTVGGSGFLVFVR